MSDWGSQGVDCFVPTSHSSPYPTIDPSNVEFPSPFVVCILGASQGIGAGIAYAYAKSGASGLVLSSRNVSKLEQVAVKCRGINPKAQVEVVACDISSSDDVATLAEAVGNKFGRMDAMIVNSGYSGNVTLKVGEDEPAMVKRATDICYVGTYYAAHYFIPLLLSSPSSGPYLKSFLAVGSTTSFIVRGPIANTQYCVAKMAQLKLIEHLHEQYSVDGLLAAAVHPGAVMSQMAEETAPKEFFKYLTDDPELCGAFMVWLTKPRESAGMEWLGGRHLVANWDVDELLQRKDEIIQKDLLKTRIAL